MINIIRGDVLLFACFRPLPAFPCSARLLLLAAAAVDDDDDGDGDDIVMMIMMMMMIWRLLD